MFSSFLLSYKLVYTSSEKSRNNGQGNILLLDSKTADKKSRGIPLLQSILTEEKR